MIEFCIYITHWGTREKQAGERGRKTMIFQAFSQNTLPKFLLSGPIRHIFNHLNELNVNQMYSWKDKTFEYVICLTELQYLRLYCSEAGRGEKEETLIFSNLSWFSEIFEWLQQKKGLLFGKIHHTRRSYLPGLCLSHVYHWLKKKAGVPNMVLSDTFPCTLSLCTLTECTERVKKE